MKAFCFINSLYQKSSLKHKLKLSFKADCILKCFVIERIYALKAFVYIQGMLWMYCLLFISMATTTYTGSTITSLNRASFQLKDTIFQHGHFHWLCIFATLREICTNKGNPPFHWNSLPNTLLLPHPLFGLCKWLANDD